MTINNFTFDDWVNNELIDVSGFGIDRPGFTKMPFHYLYSHLEERKLLIEREYFSEELLNQIKSEQVKICDNLLEPHFSANRRDVDQLKNSSGLSQEAVLTEIKSKRGEIAALNQNQSDYPVFEYLEEASIISDWRVMIDPDLYTLITDDVNNGRPLKYLIGPHDYPVNTVEDYEYAKTLISRSYALPDEVMPEHIPTYQYHVIVQRHTIARQIRVQTLHHRMQLLDNLLQCFDQTGRYVGSQENTGRGSRSSEREILMGDDFYEEARRLYRESPAACTSTRSDGPSDFLINQLHGRFRGYRRGDTDRETSEPLSKTGIKRALKKYRTLWMG